MLYFEVMLFRSEKEDKSFQLNSSRLQHQMEEGSRGGANIVMGGGGSNSMDADNSVAYLSKASRRSIVSVAFATTCNEKSQTPGERDGFVTIFLMSQFSMFSFISPPARY